jgi:hypothetical protein
MNVSQYSKGALAARAAWAVLALCLMPAAQAVVRSCDPVPGGFTVFLSEPEFTKSAFKDNDSMRDFMKRLTKQLDDGLDRRWARSPNPNPEIRFVNCVGRSPQRDGQDLDVTVINTMHSGRVLLEIWGQLDAQGNEGRPQKASAEIRYLLVPMKFYANRSEVVPEPMQRLDYVATEASSPDFVSLIAQRNDIDAFVSAALGFKLLRELNFELAHRNLCFAGAKLEKIRKRLPAGRERDDVSALQAFVFSSATRAIDSARLAPPPGAKPGTVSRLALQDPKDPCDLEIEP